MVEENNENRAVWQFRFLKTIMSEIPVYSKDLAPSVVSPDTLRRMIKGGTAIKGKCTEVKNALAEKYPEAQRVLDKYCDEMIVEKTHRNSTLTKEKVLEEMRRKKSDKTKGE